MSDLMEAPEPDPDNSAAPAFTEEDVIAFSAELDGLSEQPEFIGHHLVHRGSGLLVDFRSVIGVIPNHQGYGELVMDGLPYSIVTPYSATALLSTLLTEHEHHGA